MLNILLLAGLFYLIHTGKAAKMLINCLFIPAIILDVFFQPGTWIAITITLLLHH